MIECVNHITAAKQQPFRVHENNTAAYHFDQEKERKIIINNNELHSLIF